MSSPKDWGDKIKMTSSKDWGDELAEIVDDEFSKDITACKEKLVKYLVWFVISIILFSLTMTIIDVQTRCSRGNHQSLGKMYNITEPEYTGEDIIYFLSRGQLGNRHFQQYGWRNCSRCNTPVKHTRQAIPNFDQFIYKEWKIVKSKS